MCLSLTRVMELNILSCDANGANLLECTIHAHGTYADGIVSIPWEVHLFSFLFSGLMGNMSVPCYLVDKQNFDLHPDH